jgi:hypothetical protein
MMKKHMMVFAVALSFLSSSFSFSYEKRDTQLTRAEKRQRVLAAYISSLALSGITGALTGGTIRYLEKKLNVEACPVALFVTLLGWALESELRNDIVSALQADFDQYGIAYKKGLMFKGAWISSWISYLHM